MPVTLRRGRVTAVLERLPGLVRLEVDRRSCVAYPRLTGPVALGDDVVVNTQGVDLGLGSGGFAVLAANLTRGLDLPPEPGAHVMKLPYTPLQAAARHLEEAGVPDVPALDGLPVVCCTLHSQLVPVCAGIGPGARVACLQLAGGALPVSLSDAIRALKRARLLEIAVAVGPCVDGDLACASVASGLAWASAEGFDAVVCTIGPGVVGTGTRLGHGALAASEAANAALALGGRPILAARVSTADPRERHAPVSHHTLAVLELARGALTVAWPQGFPVEPPAGATVEQVDVAGWEAACDGLPLASMGRSAAEDPWFFAAAFAAGRLARAWTR
jgi:hypothetical protein